MSVLHLHFWGFFCCQLRCVEEEEVRQTARRLKSGKGGIEQQERLKTRLASLGLTPSGVCVCVSAEVQVPG